MKASLMAVSLVVFVTLGTLSPTRAACVDQFPSELQSCGSLDQCMKVLDAVAAQASLDMSPQKEALSRLMRRFGEPAKQELLGRAAGRNSGWRSLAGTILQAWGSWTPSDVPALRAVLRKNHGGWAARPLGQIATAEAIKALVEDLPKDRGNQTEVVLSELGAKAAPFLIPLLRTEYGMEPAQRILRRMADEAVPFVERWAALAADVKQPRDARIGALRGIAAIGARAQAGSARIQALFSDPDPGIRFAAHAALGAVRSPAFLQEVARSCRPNAAQFDEFPSASFECLFEIAALGSDASNVGQDLLPFLSSANGAERVYAITTLAAIDYRPAIPQIREALLSPDWRAVFAAARALMWLGDTTAIPQLQQVASSHWLPEVREEAKRSLLALQSTDAAQEAPRLVRSTLFRKDPGEYSLLVEADLLQPPPTCPSQRWKWQDITFGMPKQPRHSRDVTRNGAGLVGTNDGEFGGALTWQPAGRKPELILEDNVIAMEPDGEATMVLFGLAHLGSDYGYVVRVTRTGDSGWHLAEVARLPSEADVLATIGPGRFAAWSAGRVVVFTKDGIEGLAACEADQATTGN